MLKICIMLSFIIMGVSSKILIDEIFKSHNATESNGIIKRLINEKNNKEKSEIIFLGALKSLPKSKKQKHVRSKRSVAPLNERSLCKWTYHTNYNQYRIPQAMKTAVCSNTQNYPYICEPVKVTHLVHVRSPSSYYYVEKRISLAEACVCAYRIDSYSS